MVFRIHSNPNHPDLWDASLGCLQWKVCAEHGGILGSVSLNLQQAMAAEQLSLALIFFPY